jgi:glutamine synthetase
MTSELATLAEQTGTRFILALFVDLRGKPCAKLVPVEAVEQLATEGVGFAGYAVGAMGQEPKDPDLIAVPDPAVVPPPSRSSRTAWRWCTAIRMWTASRGRTRRG